MDNEKRVTGITLHYADGTQKTIMGGLVSNCKTEDRITVEMVNVVNGDLVMIVCTMKG